MAMILRPSSHSPNDDDDRNIPTAEVAFPFASLSRRLPPPCWTLEETVALIDAYREKWYSVNRGNLRASHWQEMADEVASRCPVSPPKTAVQCRHKMEKLRKRYRGKVQRAAARGVVRCSSWAHFQNMESMEKGPNNTSPSSSTSEEEDDRKNSIRRINELYNHSNIQKGLFSNQGDFINGIAPGFRIKIPGGAPPAPTKVYGKFNRMDGQNPNNSNPRFPNSIANGYGAASNKDLRDRLIERDEKRNRVGGISKKNKVDTGVDEVVAAIHALREGFMRIEKAKMDMTIQIEEMRMEMELKRAESQQMLVETLAKAIYENSSKKPRRL
ncbi:Transcription factor GT-2 [Handroanthus impetiginosus]|uniref:Transcription factor GT-2 n=1 Tax=Handroanthus impetiginosus TaxID=429701 RepID=A0A2G9GLY8_9LAMI|nr:Transcription factor GT-2 [Handroanthus impetiginosus]